MPQKEDLSAWITGLVEDSLTQSPLNNLQNKDSVPAWEEALVGFASGADPIFQEYKEYIGPFHWTPEECLSDKFIFPSTNKHLYEIRHGRPRKARPPRKAGVKNPLGLSGTLNRDGCR